MVELLCEAVSLEVLQAYFTPISYMHFTDSYSFCSFCCIPLSLWTALLDSESTPLVTCSSLIALLIKKLDRVTLDQLTFSPKYLITRLVIQSNLLPITAFYSYNCSIIILIRVCKSSILFICNTSVFTSVTPLRLCRFIRSLIRWFFCSIQMLWFFIFSYSRTICCFCAAISSLNLKVHFSRVKSTLFLTCYKDQTAYPCMPFINLAELATSLLFSFVIPLLWMQYSFSGGF